MKHILPFAIIITMCTSWFMFGYTYRAYHYKPTQSNTIIIPFRDTPSMEELEIYFATDPNYFYQYDCDRNMLIILANIISSAKGKERERVWRNDLEKLIKEFEDEKFQERERYERK